MKELYAVSNLNMVEIRRYNGIEHGHQSWTFLGYDVVKINYMFNATSILADDEKTYEVLRPLDKEGSTGLYDHEGILIGDVRVKVIDDSQLGIFGRLPYVSKKSIEKWIDKRPDFYFPNYQSEKGKVKKLGQK